MTPTEEAKKLIEKFERLRSDKMHDYSRIEYPTAKLCALIAVHLILNTCVPSRIYYWQEVKTEIEQL
jgi:hypothetical protein